MDPASMILSVSVFFIVIQNGAATTQEVKAAWSLSTIESYDGESKETLYVQNMN